MVVTEGDHFAELGAAQGLGGTVPAGDVDALVAALERYLFDEKAQEKAKKALLIAREEYRWSHTLAPLVDHVAAISSGSIVRATSQPVKYSPSRPRPPRFSIHDISRGFQRLFRGEFQSLARAVLRKLRPRRS
jgi:hypothetical protein